MAVNKVFNQNRFESSTGIYLDADGWDPDVFRQGQHGAHFRKQFMEQLAHDKALPDIKPLLDLVFDTTKREYLCPLMPTGEVSDLYQKLNWGEFPKGIRFIESEIIIAIRNFKPLAHSRLHMMPGDVVVVNTILKDEENSRVLRFGTFVDCISTAGDALCDSFNIDMLIPGELETVRTVVDKYSLVPIHTDLAQLVSLLWALKEELVWRYSEGPAVLNGKIGAALAVYDEDEVCAALIQAGAPVDANGKVKVIGEDFLERMTGLAKLVKEFQVAIFRPEENPKAKTHLFQSYVEDPIEVLGKLNLIATNLRFLMPHAESIRQGMLNNPTYVFAFSNQDTEMSWVTCDPVSVTPARYYIWTVLAHLIKISMPIEAQRSYYGYSIVDPCYDGWCFEKVEKLFSQPKDWYENDARMSWGEVKNDDDDAASESSISLSSSDGADFQPPTDSEGSYDTPMTDADLIKALREESSAWKAKANRYKRYAKKRAAEFTEMTLVVTNTVDKAENRIVTYASNIDRLRARVERRDFRISELEVDLSKAKNNLFTDQQTWTEKENAFKNQIHALNNLVIKHEKALKYGPPPLPGSNQAAPPSAGSRGKGGTIQSYGKGGKGHGKRDRDDDDVTCQDRKELPHNLMICYDRGRVHSAKVMRRCFFDAKVECKTLENTPPCLTLDMISQGGWLNRIYATRCEDSLKRSVRPKMASSPVIARDRRHRRQLGQAWVSDDMEPLEGPDGKPARAYKNGLDPLTGENYAAPYDDIDFW